LAWVAKTKLATRGLRRSPEPLPRGARFVEARLGGPRLIVLLEPSDTCHLVVERGIKTRAEERCAIEAYATLCRIVVNEREELTLDCKDLGAAAAALDVVEALVV